MWYCWNCKKHLIPPIEIEKIPEMQAELEKKVIAAIPKEVEISEVKGNYGDTLYGSKAVNYGRNEAIAEITQSIVYRASNDTYWVDKLLVETEETRARERGERRNREDMEAL
jgi:undecaprenyl pyrophosphate synthase